MDQMHDSQLTDNWLMFRIPQLGAWVSIFRRINKYFSFILSSSDYKNVIIPLRP